MNSKIKRWMFPLMIGLATMPLMGLAYQHAQNVSVSNNQEASITLGSDDYNRVFVQGSRILQVRGDANAYSIETDNVFGQVYIKPNNLKPFEIYVTTETGQTYALSVHVISGKRQDVGLDTERTKAAMFESNTPYQQALVTLLRAMGNGEPLDGFNVIHVKGNAVSLGNVATMTKVGAYEGDSLMGEIYTLQNLSSQTLTIKPEQLYRDKTAAVAMQSESIAPKSSVRVFIVQRSDEGGDDAGN